MRCASSTEHLLGLPWKKIIPTAHAPSSTYPGADNGPHQVASATTSGVSGSDSYHYDAAGNTVSRNVVANASNTAQDWWTLR